MVDLRLLTKKIPRISEDFFKVTNFYPSCTRLNCLTVNPDSIPFNIAETLLEESLTKSWFNRVDSL